MDPLAIGCIIGFVVFGTCFAAGCYRLRNKPAKLAKSPSGAELVSEADTMEPRVLIQDPHDDPVAF
jgi:hypothetical protein